MNDQIPALYERWCDEVEAHAAKRCPLINWAAVQFHWTGVFCKGIAPLAAAAALIDAAFRQLDDQRKQAH